MVEILCGEESVTSSFWENKILHLSLTIETGAWVSISWDNVKELRGLRSLLIESAEYSWSSEVLPQLFDKLTYLRALKLIKCRRWRCDNYIKEIPTNIEKLIHLKYLNLSSQKKIKRLPETLCELYNLECLAISFCTNLRQLPQGIGKLRKLMYLDNDYTNSLRYLPVGIRELIRLRRVRKFVVGGGYDRACSLESLKRLILLRECRIHGLGDVSDVGEARRAELEKKKNLFDLELRFDCTINEEQERRDDEEDEHLGSLKKLNLLRECWICGRGGVSDAGEARRAELEQKKNLLKLGLHFCHSRDGDEEQAGRRENEEDEAERLLEALGPPPNLKELRIHEYRGRRNVVPINWIMSLTNLRDLYLSYCRNCEHLPPLGKLPSLEDLHILGMESVKRVGNKFLGVESDTDGSSVIAFPKLKRLAFHTMEELEEWDFRTAIKGEIIIMPRLSSLSIDDCPKLKALPDRLLQKTTLQRLEIYGCPILEERCRKETGEDWPKIRHIPDIEIE
ncbi:hypothetical protein KPL70_015403 [Citrus sinensis]|nr:hypothetical protein KPL70_015403 [Citrus sinensis]